jgi:acetyl esterase/lipase
VTIEIRTEVEYAFVLGFRPLVLDLYLPSDREAAPVLVYFHGGGWGLGSRRNMCPLLDSWQPSFFERLAGDGVALASVDYRLSAEARFPAQLDDAQAAVRWVRAHAAELGLDAERVIAWGASAGGHLAVLAGLTMPGEVAAVIDWYAPTDLLALAEAPGPPEHDSPDSPEGRLLGGPVRDRPELAREASPIAHVRAGAPPFLILHGTADRAIPIAQSEALARALTEAGASADFEAIEGADHMWEGAPSLEHIYQRTLGFALETR